MSDILESDILEMEARCASLKERLGKQVAIVGHHYQKDSVIKFCDHVGDSLELIQQIPALDARYIVFCGVSFMGETAAMLARPDQKILLPAAVSSSRTVNMPTAAQLKQALAILREHGHTYLPLVYVNSSVELKALTGRMGGAMCTSSNLRRMLQWAFKKSAHVLFVPDRNLGRNTARQMGLKDEDMAILRICDEGIDTSVDQPLDRHLLLWPGYCRIHEAYTPSMLNEMRFQHPGCRIIVHSEASPEVVALADAAGPTSFLIHEAGETARAGKANVLVVGTELNLVDRLNRKHMNRCTVLPLLREESQYDTSAIVKPQEMLACLEAIANGTARGVELTDKEREDAAPCVTRMLFACGAANPR